MGPGAARSMAFAIASDASAGTADTPAVIPAQAGIRKRCRRMWTPTDVARLDPRVREDDGIGEASGITRFRSCGERGREGANFAATFLSTKQGCAVSTSDVVFR